MTVKMITNMALLKSTMNVEGFQGNAFKLIDVFQVYVELNEQS